MHSTSAEHALNPRFVVTSLAGEPRALYDEVYCARGEMENRIKEQQPGLFAGRTRLSRVCSQPVPPAAESFAYVLIETLRRVALAGPSWRGRRRRRSAPSC